MKHLLSKTRWFNHVSWAMALVFFYVHIAAAAIPPAQSVWQERKAAAEKLRKRDSPPDAPTTPSAHIEAPRNDRTHLAQLPSINSSVLADSVPKAAVSELSLKASPLFSAAALAKVPTPLAALPRWMESMSLTYASLKDIYIPPSWKPGDLMVVLIQDAHANAEAQRNIARVLKSLADTQAAGAPNSEASSSRILVGIEGARGPFNFRAYRSFPEPDIVKEIGDYFLKESFLTGPEYAGLTYGLAPGAAEPKPLLFWGVEEEDLYLAHVQAFKDSVPLQDKAKAGLALWSAALENLKDRKFNPSLRELDETILRYKRGAIGLGSYLKALARKNPHPGRAVSQFLAAQALEESLDFKRVEKDRAELTEVLARRLPKAELKNLLSASLSFRLGNLSHGGFYRYLKELCGAYGIDPEQRPEMDRYIRYVLASEKIRPEALFSEIADLEKVALAERVRTAEEKDLAEIAGDLTLVEKLVDFGLSPEEWDLYRARREEIRNLPQKIRSLEAQAEVGPEDFFQVLSQFEKFNDAAVARNAVLVQNLLTQARSSLTADPAPIAVLVAGGFHTRGITQILKERKVATAILTPKLGKVEGSGTEYLNVFNRDLTPLEKLFTGEKITIAAQSALPENFMGQKPPPIRPMVRGLFASISAGRMLVQGLKGYGMDREARRRFLSWLAQEMRDLKMEISEARDLEWQKDGKGVKNLVIRLKLTRTEGNQLIRSRVTLRFLPKAALSEPAVASYVFGDQKLDVQLTPIGVQDVLEDLFAAAFASVRTRFGFVAFAGLWNRVHSLPAFLDRLWNQESTDRSRKDFLLRGILETAIKRSRYGPAAPGAMGYWGLTDLVQVAKKESLWIGAVAVIGVALNSALALLGLMPQAPPETWADFATRLPTLLTIVLSVTLFLGHFFTGVVQPDGSVAKWGKLGGNLSLLSASTLSLESTFNALNFLFLLPGLNWLSPGILPILLAVAFSIVSSKLHVAFSRSQPSVRRSEASPDSYFSGYATAERSSQDFSNDELVANLSDIESRLENKSVDDFTLQNIYRAARTRAEDRSLNRRIRERLLHWAETAGERKVLAAIIAGWITSQDGDRKGPQKTLLAEAIARGHPLSPDEVKTLFDLANKTDYDPLPADPEMARPPPDYKEQLSSRSVYRRMDSSRIELFASRMGTIHVPEFKQWLTGLLHERLGAGGRIVSIQIYGSYVYGFKVAPSDIDVISVVDGIELERIEKFPVVETAVPQQVFRNDYARNANSADVTFVTRNQLARAPRTATQMANLGITLKGEDLEDIPFSASPAINRIVLAEALISQAGQFLRRPSTLIIKRFKGETQIILRTKSMRRLMEANLLLASVDPSVALSNADIQAAVDQVNSYLEGSMSTQEISEILLRLHARLLAAAAHARISEIWKKIAAFEAAKEQKHTSAPGAMGYWGLTDLVQIAKKESSWIGALAVFGVALNSALALLGLMPQAPPETWADFATRLPTLLTAFLAGSLFLGHFFTGVVQPDGSVAKWKGLGGNLDMVPALALASQSTLSAINLLIFLPVANLCPSGTLPALIAAALSAGSGGAHILIGARLAAAGSILEPSAQVEPVPLQAEVRRLRYMDEDELRLAALRLAEDLGRRHERGEDVGPALQGLVPGSQVRPLLPEIDRRYLDRRFQVRRVELTVEDREFARQAPALYRLFFNKEGGRPGFRQKIETAFARGAAQAWAEAERLGVAIADGGDKDRILAVSDVHSRTALGAAANLVRQIGLSEKGPGLAIVARTQADLDAVQNALARRFADRPDLLAIVRAAAAGEPGRLHFIVARELGIDPVIAALHWSAENVEVLADDPARLTYSLRVQVMQLISETTAVDPNLLKGIEHDFQGVLTITIQA